MQPLSLLIALLVALLASVIVYQFTLGVKFARNKREAQLDTLAGVGATSAVTGDKSQRQIKTLEDQLRAAGLNLGTNAQTAFTLLRLASAILCASAVLVFGLPPLVALTVGLGGYVLPQLWLAGQVERRTAQIEKELPDALGDLIAVLRVTQSLRNALEQVRALLAQANPKSPLAQELQWTLEDLQTDEAGAFRDLAQRATSPALKMLAFSLMIFVNSGGDYLTALEAQARGVRQTLEARGAAAAEAAEAMLTVKIIPAVLAIVLTIFLQDPFFRTFYFTFFGQMLLLGVVVVMFLGYQLIQGMVKGVA
jgi:Flp pilus assembly protein TadB